MTWVEPEDIRSVIKGLRGEYGAEFDRGMSQLSLILNRPSAVDGRPRAVDYDKVLACARLLVALSDSQEYNAGVISLAAGVLPMSCTRELPSAIVELRAKLVPLEAV